MLLSMDFLCSAVPWFCQTAVILMCLVLWPSLLKCMPTGVLYPNLAARRCSEKRSLRVRYVSPMYSLLQWEHMMA